MERCSCYSMFVVQPSLHGPSTYLSTSNQLLDMGRGCDLNKGRGEKEGNHTETPTSLLWLLMVMLLSFTMTPERCKRRWQSLPCHLNAKPKSMPLFLVIRFACII